MMCPDRLKVWLWVKDCCIFWLNAVVLSSSTGEIFYGAYIHLLALFMARSSLNRCLRVVLGHCSPPVTKASPQGPQSPRPASLAILGFAWLPPGTPVNQSLTWYVYNKSWPPVSELRHLASSHDHRGYQFKQTPCVSSPDGAP